MRLAADRDLPLLHRLEQGALHLRGRAVDLVREDEVREHRAERDLELAELLVEDPRPDDVGGHEIGRELDALELAADRLGERLHRHRLGEPGHPLDEEVAACEQCDDHPLEQGVLADDDPLHLVEHLLERRVECGLVDSWLPHLVLISFRWGVGRTAGGADRDGEADADEVAVARRVGEGGDDPDHLAVAIEQRPSGVAGIDGRVELDETFQRLAAFALTERSRPEMTPEVSEPT